MKKVRKIFKNNYKILIGLILGVIISVGGVYAAATISGSTVSYSNTTSGLSSTTVQDAIDELYDKAGNTCPAGYKCSKLIMSAYTYDSSTCVTGSESTCVKSTCYKNKTSGSCKTGTIIKYKVNDTTTVTFYVMYDNGTTMTMQSKENVVKDKAWRSSGDTWKEGPLDVLSALESATAGWSNVNYQSYTMGTTVFKKNAYTGCDSYNNCIRNSYTLSSRTARARLISVQEAENLGCKNKSGSCPVWMYNYLTDSTSYGGTANSSAEGNGYWTMNVNYMYPSNVWYINDKGLVGNTSMHNNEGARAVVVISK